MYRYLLIPFILYTSFLNAQNLVLNPGFEKVWECPSSENELTIYHWNSPTEGLANNLNACTTDHHFQVPGNMLGFQRANTGEGYAGMYLFSSTSIPPVTYREYLQGELTQNLVAGKIYKFTCFLSLSDGLSFPTDRLGIYFSKAKVNLPVYGVLPFTPQILHPGVFITDTANWTKYEGTFTATGGERYLIIGNFSSDEDTPILVDDRRGVAPYYYIDDVSLYECEKLVELGNDTTICKGETYTINAYTEGATYKWQDGSIASSYSTNKEGLYWIDVYKDQCHTRDSIYVYLKDPSFSLGNDTTLCKGESFAIENKNLSAPYLWNDGSAEAQLNVTETGKYWLTATINGCTRTDTIEVTFEEPFQVFLGNDTTLCYGEVLELHAFFPGATYLWTDQSTNATLEVKETGEYTVSIKGVACEYKDNIKVRFFDCPKNIPNVITPNEDKWNETFIIKEIRSDQWRIEIVNRWGERVYTNNNYRNEWNGKGVAGGVYYYSLQNLDSKRSYRGWIQVMK